MSLTVTQRPNQSGVWVAAKNPVIYKMTRKDFTTAAAAVTITNGGGGNTLYHINDGSGTDYSASFTVGDSIYLETIDRAYSGFGIVVSSSYSAPATFVTTTVPYVLANSSGGFINSFTLRPNYYVGVGVYKSTDNSLIGTVDYYPSRYGLLTIDVSQPILSVIDGSLPAGSVSEGFIAETSYQGFYIIHTEFWTGSGESPVTDIGNISYGLYGANQIGQNGYVTNTSVLTKQDTLKIIVGEFYTLSFVDINAYTNIFLVKSWYSKTTFYAASFTKSQLTAAKSVYTYCQALANTPTTSLYWYENLYPYINIAQGGTTTWTLTGNKGGTITVAPGVTSQMGSALCFFRNGSTVQIKWILSVGGTSTFTATLFAFDNAGNVVASSSLLTTTVALNQSGTVSITPSGDIYYVGVRVINTGGVNPITVSFGSTLSGLGPGLQLVIPTTYNQIDFQPLNVPAALPYAQSVITNAITGYIGCSQNSMTLWWRNSLGGESSWTFNYTQDSVQKLQDPFKNKWVTLYDQNLTLAQFNSLNELFSLGQIYQTPIVELTTSLDKTEARIGQQVYTVDTNGVKIGVIVIGGENKTRTRNNRHSFQVTIELPEIFG